MNLQTGFYTEVLLRRHGVRSIAILNGVDSEDQSTGEFAPFINIMSEWYVRDRSRKQKVAKQGRGQDKAGRICLGPMIGTAIQQNIVETAEIKAFGTSCVTGSLFPFAVICILLRNGY